jgi:hypothetical protein
MIYSRQSFLIQKMQPFNKMIVNKRGKEVQKSFEYKSIASQNFIPKHLYINF